MGQGEGVSFKKAHLVAWLLGLGLTVGEEGWVGLCWKLSITTEGVLTGESAA